MKPADFTQTLADLDLAIGHASVSAFLGGSWHAPEAINGISQRWAYGKCWLCLPENYAGKTVLLRVECTPYRREFPDCLVRVTAQNESRAVSYLPLDGAAKTVSADSALELLEHAKLRVCSYATPNTPLIELDFAPDTAGPADVCVREFVATLSTEELGNVLLFEPSIGSILHENLDSTKRKLAFNFRNIKIAILDE